MYRFHALRIRIAATFIVVLSASLATAQYSEKILHAFIGKDGEGPLSALVSDARGNFYGASVQGGANDWGAVFKLQQTTSGTWHETVLYSFTGGTDGGAPAALVLDESGNIFGITYYGGTSQCAPDLCGTVFEMSPSSTGWQFKSLYSFTGLEDGGYPNNLTRDGRGNLFITATQGGNFTNIICKLDSGCGTVFELSPASSGWVGRTIFAFSLSDGIYPNGGVTLDSEGNLYGTTYAGGDLWGCLLPFAECGVVFKLSHTFGDHWTQSVIYEFRGGGDGAAPDNSLAIDAQGNIYGTAYNGGIFLTEACPSGCGVVFKLTPNGSSWTESAIYTFSDGSDGGSPSSGVVLDASGNLYGGTTYGGASGYGTVYKLSPASGGNWNFSTLHSFTGKRDGAYPLNNLLLDATGNVYGGTQAGGNLTKACPDPFGCGAIFELSPGSTSRK